MLITFQESASSIASHSSPSELSRWSSCDMLCDLCETSSQNFMIEFLSQASAWVQNMTGGANYDAEEEAALPENDDSEVRPVRYICLDLIT